MSERGRESERERESVCLCEKEGERVRVGEKRSECCYDQSNLNALSPIDRY